MRRQTLWGIAILTGAAILLSGCPLLGIGGEEEEETTGEPETVTDLGIAGVTLEFDGQDQPSSITVTVENPGTVEASADLHIRLSTDTSIGSGDPTVFADSVSVPADDSQSITISESEQIDPYVQRNNVEIPEGTYYVGAILDPTDSLEENNEDNNVGVSSDTFTVSHNDPPDAAAGNDQTVYVGEEVTLDAGESSDSDGSISSFAWEFGDGASGTGEIVTHTYSSAGTYEVTLTVTDNEGATGTDSLTVTVETSGVNAAISASAQTATVDDVIYFDGRGSDGGPTGEQITSYEWDFEDDGQVDATTPTATHQFPAPGTYTVSLFVVDEANENATATVDVTVENRSPSIELNVQADDGRGTTTAYFDGTDFETVDASVAADGDDDNTALTLHFDAGATSDPDEANSELTLTWDFGDDSSGSGETVTHTFPADNTYYITLTVTDTYGESASATKVLSVVDGSSGSIGGVVM